MHVLSLPEARHLKITDILLHHINAYKKTCCR